jgi:GTPase involved in cell partitioning and DNA repair
MVMISLLKLLGTVVRDKRTNETTKSPKTENGLAQAEKWIGQLVFQEALQTKRHVNWFAWFGDDGLGIESLSRCWFAGFPNAGKSTLLFCVDFR